MSVTLVSSPRLIVPVYNPIQWVFASTNYARCDFQYICDVYVNGSFAIRLKAEPDDSGHGVFNIERVLQDFISKDFKHDLVGFQANANCSVSYYLEIREQYNSNYATTCIGAKTLSSVQYTTLPSPNNMWAWNGALQYQEYLDFNDYITSKTLYFVNDYQTRFLNHIPNFLKVPFTSCDGETTSNGWMVFGFIQDYTNLVADHLQVKTYNDVGTLIATYNISNAVTSDESVSVGVGPNNLNAWGEAQSPPQGPLITSSVNYYTVQLLDGSNNGVSEVKYLSIDKRETRFSKYRIHWLNKLGGYDSYTFDLLSSLNIESGVETFTKTLDANYAEGDRGETVLNVNAREKYKFQTNHLQRQDASWTKELYTSSDIYVVDNTPRISEYPVTSFVHNVITGTIDLVLLSNPPVGTKFKYILTLTGIGPEQQYTGTGQITGISGLGNAETDIVIPGSAGLGASIDGMIYAEIPRLTVIPMVQVSQNWDDKGRSLSKNIIYSIDLMPSYKINTQSF